MASPLACRDEAPDCAEEACDRIRKDARFAFDDSRFDESQSAAAHADRHQFGALIEVFAAARTAGPPFSTGAIRRSVGARLPIELAGGRVESAPVCHKTLEMPGSRVSAYPTVKQTGIAAVATSANLIPGPSGTEENSSINVVRTSGCRK